MAGNFHVEPVSEKSFKLHSEKSAFGKQCPMLFYKRGKVPQKVRSCHYHCLSEKSADFCPSDIEHVA